MTHHGRTLGINGLGRIGKLTLWYHLGRDEFDQFVINPGRKVNLHSVAQYLAKDSTYGALHRYLYGQKGTRDVRIEDKDEGLLRVQGRQVRVLSACRNPSELPWRQYGVRVVVDATGTFLDPVAPPDVPGGSLRSHLHAGAQVVLVTSPFKSKNGNLSMPPDAITLLHGINHHRFDPQNHQLVSSASCTTTALAHMMRPLLDRDLTRPMITAGMSTVHAATNSQPVLDSMPKAGSKDLRKTRSALDNIIITSTNAARTLEEVMPEIARIGFMADSVRIPTSTVSLIILNLTFQTDTRDDGSPSIDRDKINAIYREAAEGEAHGLVTYTEEQNVSADIIGEDAAVVIEASETHTRTGFIDVRVPEGGQKGNRTIRIPVTHVKVFGWYDNEMGSYTFRLGDLTSYVANSL